jgi:hypothetical protein
MHRPIMNEQKHIAYDLEAETLHPNSIYSRMTLTHAASDSATPSDILRGQPSDHVLKGLEAAQMRVEAREYGISVSDVSSAWALPKSLRHLAYAEAHEVGVPVDAAMCMLELPSFAHQMAALRLVKDGIAPGTAYEVVSRTSPSRFGHMFLEIVDLQEKFQECMPTATVQDAAELYLLEKKGIDPVKFLHDCKKSVGYLRTSRRHLEDIDSRNLAALGFDLDGERNLQPYRSNPWDSSHASQVPPRDTLEERL